MPKGMQGMMHERKGQHICNAPSLHLFYTTVIFLTTDMHSTNCFPKLYVKLSLEWVLIIVNPIQEISRDYN